MQLLFKKVTHKTWTVSDVTQQSDTDTNLQSTQSPDDGKKQRQEQNNADPAFPKAQLS